MQLAHFSQAKPRAASSSGGAQPTIETRKEKQDHSEFSKNETKNETVLDLSRGTRQ